MSAEEFAEQIEELLDTVQKIVEKEIPNLKGVERTEKCAYLKNRLNRAKQLHRSIVVEIRDMPDIEQDAWKARANDYERRCNKLQADVQWAETSAETNGSQKVDEMETKEIVQMALKVQDKTQESTARSKNVVQETITIGVTVNKELVKQGEQLKKVAQDVEQIEDNITRANKQLQVFMRRLATDKIFLLLIFLVVVGIIIAIVIYVLRRQGIIMK